MTFHGPETTSEMRQALCVAVCAAVYHADADTKQRLHDTLLDAGFEHRSDDALIDLAYLFVPEPAVTLIVATKRPDRVGIRATYLCPQCLDDRHILMGDGRWYRCPRCNMAPEPKEPKP